MTRSLKVDFFIQALNALKDSHNLRTLRDFTHFGVYISENPKAKKLLNFASNDYLGLSTQSAVFLDSALARENAFFSSSSSRLLSGGFEISHKLESLLGTMFDKSCLLFNSGYHANIGLIESLSRIEDVFFLLDSFVHASVFDGIKLSRARFARFRHNDLEHLRALLQENAHKYKECIIVTEALFSMDGDFAPLKELITLKKEFSNLKIYLDEAHSIGVCGDLGLGLAKSLGVENEVDFIVLTFGKAIGSVGACVLCSASAREFFVNFARSLIYSTALPPINIAFSYFVFSHLADFRAQRAHLQELSIFFKKNLSLLVEKHTGENADSAIEGFVLGESQILSLVLGSNERALKAYEILGKYGIFAPAIRYPTIPKNTARLRFSLTALMQKEHLEQALCALQEFFVQKH